MPSDSQSPEPLRSSVPYGQCLCAEGPTLSSASVLPRAVLGSDVGCLAHRSRIWAQRGSGLGLLVPPVAASGNYTEESSPVLVFSVGDLHLVGDLLKLTSFLLGPFPCKAITKIFWLTTRQG